MLFTSAYLHMGLAILSALALAISAGPQSLAEDVSGPPNFGPRFHLVDQHHRPVDEALLASKPTILHFGFTNCPAVCPTILFEVGEYIRELGDQADRFNFVFVTVDPERDTPELLGSYLQSFDDRIIGLSGYPSQIKALADGLQATFSRHDLANGSYTYDHTVYGYLLSAGWIRQGALYLGTGARRPLVLAELRRLASRKSDAH